VEYTIEFGAHPLVDVTITTSGRADVDGFRRINDQVVADSRFRPGSTLLFDHSALDARSLTPSDIAQIAGMGGALGEPGLIVLVVPDAFTFGLARQGSTMAGPAISDSVRIFYSRDDAEAWLSAGGGDEFVKSPRSP
jgi:hypothetical protein